MFCADPLYGSELCSEFYLFAETKIKRKPARLPMDPKFSLSQLTQAVDILLNN